MKLPSDAGDLLWLPNGASAGVLSTVWHLRHRMHSRTLSLIWAALAIASAQSPPAPAPIVFEAGSLNFFALAGAATTSAPA